MEQSIIRHNTMPPSPHSVAACKKSAARVSALSNDILFGGKEEKGKGMPLANAWSRLEAGQEVRVKPATLKELMSLFKKKYPGMPIKDAWRKFPFMEYVHHSTLRRMNDPPSSDEEDADSMDADGIPLDLQFRNGGERVDLPPQCLAFLMGKAKAGQAVV